MRLLCFSDVHGNVNAVKTMLGDVRRRDAVYDAFIFAGDLTNMSSLKKTMKEKRLREALFGKKPRQTKAFKEYLAERNERYFNESKRTTRRILALLTQEGRPVYYIFGNRDRHAGYDLRNVTDLFNSKYAICLDHVKKVLIGEGIYVTASKQSVDRHTIFVQHSPGNRGESYKIYKKSLLHVSGHTHQAIIYDHYLNTGFLYRDETRGARPMPGGYFDVIIEDGKLAGITFNSLGDLFRSEFEQNGIRGTAYSTQKQPFPFKLSYV